MVIKFLDRLFLYTIHCMVTKWENTFQIRPTGLPTFVTQKTMKIAKGISMAISLKMVEFFKNVSGPKQWLLYKLHSWVKKYNWTASQKLVFLNATLFAAAEICNYVKWYHTHHHQQQQKNWRWLICECTLSTGCVYPQ